MILCLTGAAGSGREYAMEQICAGQKLALILIDGETFRGTERELNACILSAMLYEAYPCVWSVSYTHLVYSRIKIKRATEKKYTMNTASVSYTHLYDCCQGAYILDLLLKVG